MAASDRWIRMANGSYFVRFVSHRPPQCKVNADRRLAYCFASDEDAQRVLDQLLSYGYKARIVMLRPEPAPPPPPEWASPYAPPAKVRRLADRIIAASRNTPDGATPERVKRGYRQLAREFHPDRGGSTADMQNLNDAYQWMRGNTWWAESELSLSLDDIPMEDEPFADIPFATPADPGEPEELTDDDIPF